MKKKYLYFLVLLAMLALVACSNQLQNATSYSNTTTTSSSSEIKNDEDYFDALVEKIEKVTTDNYKSEDYEIWDYKTILRKPSDYFAIKMRIDNLEILQITNEGEYKKILASTPNNDFYMIFLEKERDKTNFLEDDKFTINGRYLQTYEYMTMNNTTKKVPLIYMDAYLMLNK